MRSQLEANPLTAARLALDSQGRALAAHAEEHLAAPTVATLKDLIAAAREYGLAWRRVNAEETKGVQ